MDPRPEYPRPQMVRDRWQNLNGAWEFEIDNACVGEDKNFFERERLDSEILLPFCPESKLSGIGHTDFMNCVWYARNAEIPESWQGKRILLHIGAVDWHAKLWVNGKFVAAHKGGYVPFDADITDYLQDGKGRIVLCAYDDPRSGKQPSGKQCHQVASHGCYYTRTTGIWQSVWWEPVEDARLLSFRVYPNISDGTVGVTLALTAACIGQKVCLESFFDGRPTGSAEATANSTCLTLPISLSEKHLWEVGKGDLYDLIIRLPGDEVRAYFGLREVCVDQKSFFLNGKRVFGRFVLDQGFYPDGIYTAPSEEALKNDILYSMRLGFNGARLHEKVFEPRYLYWADKLGYLVWGEMANWGLDHTRSEAIDTFLPEWLEAVERDFSHPSIIGWCPFNETWDIDGRKQHDDVIKLTYLATKAADPTRPVIDTSGNFHTETDIFDVHDYEQDPEAFAAHFEKASEGIVLDTTARTPHMAKRQKYLTDRPLFVSEYGGIKWADGETVGWGYGSAVQSETEFIQRYKGLTDALLDHPGIMGFCYTQLFDVEQEINGLMTYDRRFKFDPDVFYRINTRKAANED